MHRTPSSEDWGQIEGGRDIFGMEFIKNRQKRHREPIDSIHDLAVLRSEGRQGMIGPMDDRVPVEENQDFWLLFHILQYIPSSFS